MLLHGFECIRTYSTTLLRDIHFVLWVALFPLMIPLAFLIAILSFDDKG